MLLTFLQSQNEIRYNFYPSIIQQALLVASSVMTMLLPVETNFCDKNVANTFFCT